MATRTIQTYTSDLTGTPISNDSERVEIRVLDHPDIDSPVCLDAYALEVQGLFDAAERYVTVDVVMPGQQPRRLTLPAHDFARVFTTDVTEALRTAERSATPAINDRRGTRPPASTSREAVTPRMSREQRGAVRHWANRNGFQVGERGRIHADILAAFEAAH